MKTPVTLTLRTNNNGQIFPQMCTFHNNTLCMQHVLRQAIQSTSRISCCHFYHKGPPTKVKSITLPLYSEFRVQALVSWWPCSYSVKEIKPFVCLLRRAIKILTVVSICLVSSYTRPHKEIKGSRHLHFDPKTE